MGLDLPRREAHSGMAGRMGVRRRRPCRLCAQAWRGHSPKAQTWTCPRRPYRLRSLQVSDTPTAERDYSPGEMMIAAAARSVVGAALSIAGVQGPGTGDF